MRISTQNLENGNKVVTVEYGANELPVQVEQGDTVFSIRQKVAGELNLPAPDVAPASINGRTLTVEEEKATPVADVDNVTYLKKSGSKN